jgi:HlyD family secretion protein
MKLFRIVAAIIMTGGMVFLSLSCTGANASTPTPTPQIVTVKRGNINVTVTGTGNLALQKKQELSFGQTGIASQTSTAKISEVNVVPGQTVKQGDVLVKADTTDYQDQLITDQHNLDSVLAGLAQAQTAVSQSQLALIQDQAALVKARQSLNSQQDVQNLQNQIDNANIQLQQAVALLQQARAASDQAQAQYWTSQIVYFSENTNPGSKTPDGGKIGVLQQQMNNLLSNPSNAGATLINSGANGVSQIQADVLATQQAQAKIVTDQANIINAQNNVVLAQNKVDDAQTTLTNDKNSAQEIDAPFDGLITQVQSNVTTGAIVQRNATLIEIAVADQFVANIMVTEHDVLSLKTGENAVVSLNAITGNVYPAKITQIAPLATIQQGVVNYQISVQLSSANPLTAGTQRPSTSATPSAGTTAVPSPSPTATQNVTLKDGLSVLVTIPIQSRTNVLMLPSRAITRSAQNYTVQKMVGATAQTVTIQTGITDGTNTEIVSGLNEGDQVLERTTTSSTTGGGGFGGIRIPGGG